MANSSEYRVVCSILRSFLRSHEPVPEGLNSQMFLSLQGHVSSIKIYKLAHTQTLRPQNTFRRVYTRAERTAFTVRILFIVFIYSELKSAFEC